MLCPRLSRATLCSLAAAFLILTAATPAFSQDFEVWLIDQSNSPGKTHGGRVYIYEGQISTVVMPPQPLLRTCSI
jgi:hypothetical protein